MSLVSKCFVESSNKLWPPCLLFIEAAGATFHVILQDGDVHNVMSAEQERKSFHVGLAADLFGRECVLDVLDKLPKKMILIYHGVDIKRSDQLCRELADLIAVLKGSGLC
jgi:hypothetical protein